MLQSDTGPISVSHFHTRLPSSADGPDQTVQNQPVSDLVLADCVRFWPNGSGPEARLGVQESSGPLLVNPSDVCVRACVRACVCV